MVTKGYQPRGLSPELGIDSMVANRSHCLGHYSWSCFLFACLPEGQAPKEATVSSDLSRSWWTDSRVQQLVENSQHETADDIRNLDTTKS